MIQKNDVLVNLGVEQKQSLVNINPKAMINY